MKSETKDLLRHVFHSAREALASASADRWQRIGFLLLVLLILVAPAIYGGVTPVGIFVIQLLAFSSAGCALASRASAHRLGFLAWPLGALFLLALLGVLQLMPLPAPVLAAVSPESARIWADARTNLAAFGRTTLPAPRVSIAPGETVTTILLTLAYGAAFIAALRLAARRPGRRLILGALLTGAFLQILIALWANAGEGRTRGPFVNPDHFAGWLEISIPFALALLLLSVTRLRDSVGGILRPKKDHRLEIALAKVGGAVFLWLLLVAGAVRTHSRGGMIAIAVATLVFIFLHAFTGFGRSAEGVEIRRGGILDGAGAALIGLLFLGLAVGREPLLRFLALDPREVGQDDRVRMWQISIEAWKRFPVVGSGLGTFREAFRLVQPREFTGLVEQAHQDGLQLLVTGGAVGAVLGVAVVLLLAAYLLRSWHTALRTEDRLLGLAGLSALVSLLVHGLAEFNFSIPSIPVTLAAALGMAVAAVRSKGNGEPNSLGQG